MTELEEAFALYKSRYFRNRLKPCRVMWADMEYLGHFGSYRQEGVKEDKYHYIKINRKLKWSGSLWHFTLLHEMVHLKLVGKDLSPLDKHSRMFNREMKKLAAVGAFVGIW